MLLYAALDSLTKKAEGLSAIVDYFKISPEAISVKFPLSERVSFPKYREVMPFDILSFERLCAKESEWIKYMEAYYAEIKNRLPFANRKQKIKNIEGGFSDDVFRILGLKSKKEWIYGVSSARDMIVNNIDHENCFLCASTKFFLDDSIKKAEMGLVNNHAYSLNKYDKYSDTVTVNNPHYSSVDIKLTMKEFCDNFGLIHFGKLL